MSDLAFHALREYQPGDDRRYIHWRSSAKAGRLLVRQFLDTRRSHVTVIVDPDPEQYRSGHGKTGSPTATSSATSWRRTPRRRSRRTSRRPSRSAARSWCRVMLDEQDWTVVCGRQKVSRSGPADRSRRDGPGRAGPRRPAHDLRSTRTELAPDTSTSSS